MKLWLLKRLDRIGWDEYIGLVIRAESEQAARDLACEYTRRNFSLPNPFSETDNASCIEITIEGVPEVILDSFRAG